MLKVNNDKEETGKETEKLDNDYKTESSKLEVAKKVAEMKATGGKCEGQEPPEAGQPGHVRRMVNDIQQHGLVNANSYNRNNDI